MINARDKAEITFEDCLEKLETGSINISDRLAAISPSELNLLFTGSHVLQATTRCGRTVFAVYKEPSNMAFYATKHPNGQSSPVFHLDYI